MSKEIFTCDWCGKKVMRYRSCIGKHVFCDQECSRKYKTKKLNPEGYTRHPHLSELNRDINPERMTSEVRAKLRQARLGLGEGKSYTKTFGTHTHRLVAEHMLGRPLLPEEVVHHIDGNKLNNRPENLMVFPSQKEHAAWHAKWNSICRRTVWNEEVMLYEI